MRTFVVPPGQAELDSWKAGRVKPPHRTLEDKLNDESIAEVVREFLRQRLADPKHELNKSKRALFYRVSGKVRFMVRARKSWVNVIQIGRFANDEAFWPDHLSDKWIGLRRNANDLSFALSTREDFNFFQDTMEHKIAGLHWLSLDADRDEGEENEDEDH